MFVHDSLVDTRAEVERGIGMGDLEKSEKMGLTGSMNMLIAELKFDSPPWQHG